jgi:hypothetical protein
MSQLAPAHPAAQVHAPLPAEPSLHVPWAPHEGQASQLGPKKPGAQELHAAPVHPAAQVHAPLPS